MDSDNENVKFVSLIDEYKIILDKSQNPAIKEAKRVAIIAFIDKWTAISGKSLTQKSILKKISNLKVRTKAAEGKKQPLCEWQSKLLDITKGTDDDEQEPLPVVVEAIDMSADGIVEGYETSETKKLSNNQLERIILLEKFKIVKLKRMKMERELKTAVASDGSGNKIEIEYIGFDDMANVPTE